ncbi:MAG: TIGR01459 family HAD-type hydrolase [Pseudomonadota bacterium]|nr:TIGR01459 family HAD-type hydrolase [Pseudomonadota bacterium]
MTRLVCGLADLASGYKVILSDVWGVVHNGLMAFEGATEALSRFRAGGGKVVLMTNSPNPGRIVEAQLARLGVSRNAYDAIVSSGDVTVSLLVERAGAGLFHLGPPDETALFEEVLGLRGEAPRLVPLKHAQFVLCTGLADPWHETPADYDAILAAMRARNLELICANPDIVVEDGGKWFYCAGAIAERYAGAGGKVIQAGKPFAPIFTRALEVAREPGTETIDRARVLVIGDAMRTDIKGAHDQGFDSLFVTSGIHRTELHGGSQDTGLDAAAFRQFMEASDFAPTAAIPELVW